MNSLIAVNMLLIERKQKQCQPQPNFSRHLISDELHVAAAHGHYQVVVFVTNIEKMMYNTKTGCVDPVQKAV
jgi:hypothetical protein